MGPLRETTSPLARSRQRVSCTQCGTVLTIISGIKSPGTLCPQSYWLALLALVDYQQTRDSS